jgi:hypothetical protein
MISLASFPCLQEIDASAAEDWSESWLDALVQQARPHAGGLVLRRTLMTHVPAICYANGGLNAWQ